MTAADRDREAFEAAAGAVGFDMEKTIGGAYDSPLTGDARRLWDAALTHARAQAGGPVAAGAWTREDLAAGLAELDGIDLVPPLKSVVDLEYLNRADDLLTFLSVASAANEPLGAIHPAPAQEPVAVPAGFVQTIAEAITPRIYRCGDIGMPWDEAPDDVKASMLEVAAGVVEALAAAPVSPPAEQKVFPQDFEPAGGWPRRLGAGDIAALKDGRIGKIEDVGASTYGLRMTDGEFITVHHEAVSPPADSGESEDEMIRRILAASPEEVMADLREQGIDPEAGVKLMDDMAAQAEALASTPAPQPCPTCSGKGYGQEWMGDDKGAAITDCSHCNGTGHRQDKRTGKSCPCPRCEMPALQPEGSWFAEDVRRASERQAKIAAEWPSARVAAPPQAQDFAKGAEAMREACAKEASGWAKFSVERQAVANAIEDAIRALPLPTQPAGEG